MNLFIIPSWYPSETSPLSGVFIKEQAEAIAAIRPDTNVIVSTWGHGSTLLNARSPWYWPKRIAWAIQNRKTKIEIKNKVKTILTSSLSWSERLPFYTINPIIRANRKNLLAAKKEFGKIDVIHAHVSFPAGFIAYQLSKEFGIPYVITEHMGPFPFPPYMVGDLPRPEIIKAFNNAVLSIAVSPSLANKVASFGLPKPHVIPNVVDERVFTAAAPNSNKIVFFTLCGLTDQKGIDHLLEAIALWNPLKTEYEFRIGGDGPLRECYQTKAEKLGIADRVKWLGNVTRKQAPNLFQECHIYVMASRHETFGVVYAEAIASGKPIIATRCGGPEFIVNETNGVLVDIGDIPALSKAMQQMVENWGNYNPQAIRQDFEQRFSRTAVVTELMEVYQAIAQKDNNL